MAEENLSPPAASTPKQSGGGGAKIAIIIIILVIVVLGGGLFAYGKFVKKASSLSSIMNPLSPKLNPNCKYNDPDLCKFVNNWKDVKEMTMVADSTEKDGKKGKWTYKIDGDDNQMIMEESGTENYNAITIANTTYTKDYTDNKWWKYTHDTNLNTNSEAFDIDFDDKAAEAEDKTTYEKIGKEACGKYTCFKYKVIDPANTDSTEYIYFDDKEYLLRKTRSEDKDGSVNEATLDYSNVSISEPSPTKEGDPYSSALEGMNFNSSTTTPTSSYPSSSSNGESTPEETYIPEEIPAEVPYGDEAETPVE